MEYQQFNEQKEEVKGTSPYVVLDHTAINLINSDGDKDGGAINGFHKVEDLAGMETNGVMKRKGVQWDQ